MNKEKQLPKEVIRDIVYLSSGNQDAINGARIAQSHYEPIISETKANLKVANDELSRTITELDICLTAYKAQSKELSAKDATIAKIMGLLKESKESHYAGLMIPNSQWASLWESFRQEKELNNLPQ